MRPVRLPAALAGMAAALVLGAGTGAATYAVLDDGAITTPRTVTVTSPEPVADTAGLSIGEIYRRSEASVVKITVRGATSSSFGQPGRGAVGSGFVYDRDGHVVTNQHVVDGGGSITVLFSDGSRYPATVVGTDRSTDLAVLRVDAPESKLRPLALGDSDAVEVGDAVVAMGSPFGLEGSVTSGIVSALQRQMTAPNGFTINDSIQTDAAINHGNSGGPLLDVRGRVIGVNAQIESDSGGNDGVGFAIPSNTVRSIVTQIVDGGRAEHAYLGVTLVATSEGVAISEVRSGTPAEKAGLRAATGTRLVDGEEVPTGGDVIVAFEGTPVASEAELQSAVDAKSPGDTASLTLLRDGRRVTIEVTLGTRPS